MDITFSFRSKDLKRIMDSMSTAQKEALHWFVGFARIWKESNPTGSVRDFWKNLPRQSSMDTIYYNMTNNQQCVIDFFVCKIILENRFLENDKN